MLNEIQRSILKSTFEMYFESIRILDNPDEAVMALNTINNDDSYNQNKDILKNLNIYDSIDFFRSIIKHPNPQNRTATVYQVNGGNPNFSYYKDNEGRLSSEPMGLLGLTARNDNTAAFVTKSDVIKFINDEIAKEIDFQGQRKTDIEEITKRSEHYIEQNRLKNFPNYEDKISRERYFNVMNESFTKTNIIILNGMEGIGKTSLAIKFAAISSYKSFFFNVTNSEDEKIFEEFKNLNNQMKRRFIIIFDNVKNIQEIAKYLEYINSHENKENIKLIITSRNKLYIRDANIIEVGFFTRNEALKYLQSEQDRNIADKMMKNIVRHPKIFAGSYESKSFDQHSTNERNILFTFINNLNNELKIIEKTSETYKEILTSEIRLLDIISSCMYEDIRNVTVKFESDNEPKPDYKISVFLLDLIYKLGHSYEELEITGKNRIKFNKILFRYFDKLYENGLGHGNNANRRHILSKDAVNWLNNTYNILKSSSKNFELFLVKMTYLEKKLKELEGNLSIEREKLFKEIQEILRKISNIKKVMKKIGGEKEIYQKCIYDIDMIIKSIFDSVEIKIKLDEKNESEKIDNFISKITYNDINIINSTELQNISNRFINLISNYNEIFSIIANYNKEFFSIFYKSETKEASNIIDKSAVSLKPTYISSITTIPMEVRNLENQLESQKQFNHLSNRMEKMEEKMEEQREDIRKQRDTLNRNFSKLFAKMGIEDDGAEININNNNNNYTDKEEGRRVDNVRNR